MRQKAGLTAFFLLLISSLYTEARPCDFQLPLRITPVLSANFGELRNDHFHSGLDFKTQGVTGKSVHAVADGFVSRISVRKYGYGKALYIDHPNGYTSVYAHLEHLSPRLDSILRDGQYEAQSYELNLIFEAGKLPVKQGEIVAYSGNTGGSGGPHLHFEIRDTKSEDVIDPLLWYAPHIKDHVKPRIQALAIYRFNENNSNHLTEKHIITIQDNLLQSDPPLVWGDIAVGLKAYDYMSDTHNIYGIQSIRLFLDDMEIFSQDMSRFSFDNTRYINYITDYEEWALRRSWIMRSYFPHNGKGIVHVDEEKNYHFRYELSDRHGNTCIFPFVLQGKKPRQAGKTDDKSSVPMSKDYGRKLYPAFQNDLIYREAILRIPAGSLYETTELHYGTSPTEKAFSPIYHIGYAGIPLHKKMDISLAVTNDRLSDKKHYYLAYRNHKNEWEYLDARYEKGWIQASVYRFGDYAVLADTISPKISFANIDNDLKNDLIRILVRDDESDIARYQVSIDGKWALFEDDYKRDAIFYRVDGAALQRTGGEHRLEVSVWDHCGNRTDKETLFIY